MTIHGSYGTLPPPRLKEDLTVVNEKKELQYANDTLGKGGFTGGRNNVGGNYHDLLAIVKKL